MNLLNCQLWFGSASTFMLIKLTIVCTSMAVCSKSDCSHCQPHPGQPALAAALRPRPTPSRSATTSMYDISPLLNSHTETKFMPSKIRVKSLNTCHSAMWCFIVKFYSFGMKFDSPEYQTRYISSQELDISIQFYGKGNLSRQKQLVGIDMLIFQSEKQREAMLNFG